MPSPRLAPRAPPPSPQDRASHPAPPPPQNPPLPPLPPPQDALGPSGAGPGLRAHCEAALRQLQREESAAALLCVLEAFAHDGLGPLAQWGVTASARGGSAAAGTGLDEEAAELALRSAQQKLGGADEGGVEAQVQLLVQQATDELRLMAMPPSWRPWL